MAVGGNADLVPGKLVRRAGFFTKAAYLRGVGQAEIEVRLGFKRGRLDAGWWLLFLTDMPGPDDFEMRGHTQFPGGADQGRSALSGQDLRKHKERLVAEVFTLKGSARLAKAVPKSGLPGDPADPDYPPGNGIPQWELRQDHPMTWKVAAFLQGGEVYNGFYV